MGHFKESSCANLMFINGTILATITTTTTKTNKKPSSPKKTSLLFLSVVYDGEGILAFRRTSEIFLGSNWGIGYWGIEFIIHWCTLYRFGGRIKAAHYQLKDHL